MRPERSIQLGSGFHRRVAIKKTHASGGPNDKNLDRDLDDLSGGLVARLYLFASSHAVDVDLRDDEVAVEDRRDLGLRPSFLIARMQVDANPFRGLTVIAALIVVSRGRGSNRAASGPSKVCLPPRRYCVSLDGATEDYLIG
jgi:hypothetical protein